MSEATRSAAATRQRAQTLLDLGRYEEALATVAKALVSDPQDSGLLCLGAVANLNLGRLADCRAMAEGALAADPDSTWALRLLALAYLRLGMPREALGPVNQLVRTAPNEWQTHVVASDVCAVLPQTYRKAGLDAAQRAIQLAPDEPETHIALGRACFAANDMKGARRAFLEALSVDPQNSVAMNELGRIRLKRRDHFGAAKHFAQAVSSDVRSDVAAYNLDVALRGAVGWLFLWLWLLSLTFGRAAMVSRGHAGWVLGWITLALLAVLFLWQGTVILRGLRGAMVRNYVRELPRRNPSLTKALALMGVGLVALVALCLVPPGDLRLGLGLSAAAAMVASQSLLAYCRRLEVAARGRLR